MTRRRGSAPSQRQRRVGETLRHALGEVLRDAHIHDPDLTDKSITVTEVRASPDLRNATAYIVPLGGANAEAVLAGLQRATPYLRGQLARHISLRYTPRLRFALDDTFDQVSRIETLLRQPGVARDLAGDPAAGDHDGA